MDKLDSEVCMKMNVESETEFDKMETNALEFRNKDHEEGSFLFGSTSTDCNVAKSNSQDDNQSSVFSRMKVGHDVFVITPSYSTPMVSDVVGKSEAHEEVKEVDIPSTDHATHENCDACEEWRIRGNEAYYCNDLSKAEDCYTQGIVSIPATERSECCHKPLSRCHSNRAAARVSLGRIREALADSLMAIALDPFVLEDRVRTTNCHLSLGEVENALQFFNDCLESETVACLDQRIVIECADGIQKAQKVAESTNRSANLLEQRTTDAALSALGIISEALSVSEYSEKLLEMKADALYLLRRYEEAIQVCEQSLYSAERNSFSMDGSGCENCPFARLWRWVFISKSYFLLGRFEAALGLVKKLEQVGSIKDKYGSNNLESSISAAVTIRELLSHKTAGNEAFRSGRYTEAVEHYTVALSSNIGSRPFAAICLGNRAAAHQALDQIMDAIADCSLAIALDGNYIKAVSRRATLHEMIRDYVQAANDLQRLLSIMENQADDKAKESTLQGSCTGSAEKLRQAHRRLPSTKEKAKKGIPLNFNLILQIKPSDTSYNIKKAYRMAALKHHPDKAGQFLATSKSRDEGQLWKEISVEVQKDADRLFKMIGEAYAVLSDPTKRSEYDREEDMRKATNKRKECSSHRKSSEFQSPRKPSDFQSPRSRRSRKPGFYSSPFGINCRGEKEGWRSYGSGASFWQW